MAFKPLTEKEILKMGRVIPVCGNCYRQYVQLGEFLWADPCGSNPKVAHIGAPKDPNEKKARKLKTK